MTTGNQIAGYRILMEVGQGAASTLYAVQDPKSKQVWALKHVRKHTDKDQRFLDQVETEYVVGRKLRHPNIREVYRLIKHRKRFRVCEVSLLMELVDASSLDQRLPRTYSSAVSVFRHVAEALDHMHDRGYVHADIKPSNILVGEDDLVKIIDLGQSCPIGTVKTRIQGTPGYMAPEQAHRREVIPQTDVYNLGATMYWVLVRDVIPTAMPPKGDDSNGLYKGALDEELIEPPVPPIERNPRIHPLLSKLILDCVEVETRKRPESMKIVADRLDLIEKLLLNPPPPRESSMVDAADETTVFDER